MSTLGSIIFNALSSDPELSALVGSRIRHQQRKQRETYPCITWIRIAGAPEVTHSGPLAGEEVRVRFTCWDRTEAGAEALAETLRTALPALGETTDPVAIYEGSEPDVKPEGSIHYVIVETALWYEPGA